METFLWTTFCKSSCMPLRWLSASSRKGSGKGSGALRMPLGLIGHRCQDLQGRPLCFSYNLGSCAAGGSSCNEGQHACAGCCAAGHSLTDCHRVKCLRLMVPSRLSSSSLTLMQLLCVPRSLSAHLGHQCSLFVVFISR